MTAISVTEMQRDLPRYLARVAAGEPILILQDEEPVAELRPVAPSAHQPRPYGLCAGEFTVPDDFDQPLPEDVLREFEGR